MIEIVRYVLAMIVAETHVWGAGPGWTAHQSVFAFYTLSGYLITRVLNTRYGFSFGGFFAFAVNRILRLWPAYLIVIVLAATAYLVLPSNPSMNPPRLPVGWREIVTNLTIVGQVGFDFREWALLDRLSWTSWSLSIEVVCYILLALLFALSATLMIAFAIIGAVAIGWSTVTCAVSAHPELYGPYCYQNRYGVIQAGFIPFAIGGLTYFYSEEWRRFALQHWWRILIAFAIAEAACFVGDFVSMTIGPFVGSAAMSFLILCRQDRRATRTQDFIGRSSYHLFIAHIPVQSVLIVAFGMVPASRPLWLWTLAGCLLLSAGIVPLERRVNRLREEIRAGQFHQLSTEAV